jgi:tetratricopeptide (TPR) repeat protein
MTKQIRLKIILAILLLISCIQKEDLHTINEIPMYGNIEKTKEQLYTDSIFIKDMLKRFEDRKSAAIATAKRGWEFFRQGDKRTAIKRFNQSWLLDSLCPYAIWGFGVYMGSFGNYSEAINLLNKTIELLPNDANLTSDLAFTYGVLSYNKKKQISHDTALISDSLFKTAYRIDSSNTVVLNQWILTKYLLDDCLGAYDLRLKLLKINSQSIDTQTINRMKKDLNIKCND